MSVFYTFSAFVRPAMVGTAALLLGLAASCTYSHGDPAPACNASTQTITYAGVISPIFDAHCRECHASSQANNKGGGNDFGDYTGISRYPSTRLLGCIKQEPGYPAMPQGRPKLSDCDIERIQRWIDAGKPNN
jgi:mono/diheme cytochrome c family protein